MKKFLLSCFAISALLFTSCSSSDDSDDAAGYVLTISPSTISLSGSETSFNLTITGEDAADMSWTSCFEPLTDGGTNGACLLFPDGNSYDLPLSMFAAGEYQFYAECYSEGIKTAYANITITE